MKIMLVDDSRAIAAVISARLESFGHEVLHVDGGRLALEKFTLWTPDLILMDIEMPEMNGFETTTRIRSIEGSQAWAWTPIIFLTASDTPDNLVTAIEAGGDDFIAKSVPEAVLQAKMKAMARIATLRQRLTQANHKLRDQANKDGLTGLFNRRYLDLQIDMHWEDAVRKKQAFGLLMIDVDHFKKYNDSYGHLAGDDCLKEVASALQESVMTFSTKYETQAPFAARYGGEEFSVIFPEADALCMNEFSALVIQNVQKRDIAHELNAEWGKVTVSIGAAHVLPAHGEIKSLFRKADDLLYRAKRQGRNRVEHEKISLQELAS